MAADNAIKVKTKPRLDYIDIAKGFVIFLCVLGHAVHFGGLTFRFIFLFHMPFFFIISGWCKAIFDKQKTFLTVIKNNTIKLLLPSLIYRVLISIPIVNVKDAAINVFLNPYYEWFLPTMFASNILFFFFYKFDKKYDIKSYIRIAIAIAVSAVSTIMIIVYKEMGLHMKVGFPISMDCALLGFVYIVIGYELKKVFDAENTVVSIRKPSIIPLFAVFALIFILSLYSDYINLADCELGNSSAFAIFAASYISITVIWISKKSNSLKTDIKLSAFLKKLLILWGRYSLWVYLLHLLINKAIEKVFLVYSVSIDDKTLRAAVFCTVDMAIITLVLMIYDKMKTARIKHKSK